MVKALRGAREATGIKATPEADRNVAERVHLIERDGENGSNIHALREKVGQTIEPVASCSAMRSSTRRQKTGTKPKALAEGGLVGQGDACTEAGYERSEKELFDRIEGMGRGIESNVLT